MPPDTLCYSNSNQKEIPEGDMQVIQSNRENMPPITEENVEEAMN